MIRQFFKGIAIVYLAIAMLLIVPTPADAAGWFGQRQGTQQTSPMPQSAQDAQEEQYAQENQYAQESQSYPDQDRKLSTANNQSNQPGSQNGESIQGQ